MLIGPVAAVAIFQTVGWGCEPRPPKGLVPAELVGGYRSSGGAVVVLGQAGTARVDALDLDEDLVTGAGSWRFGPDGSLGDSSPVVDLAIDEGTGMTRFTLMVTGTRSDPVLYDYRGDPDSCELVTFRRRQA